MEESGSSKPVGSECLREIVDRATGTGQKEHEHRTRQPRPSRVLRVLIGLVLLAGGLSGLGYALVHLMHTGTCASGPTPYVIAHQCPSGTGGYIGLLVGGLFVALIGVAIAGLGLAFPGGIGFTATGAVALYGGLTTPSSAQGAALAGYIVGATFIAMGLLYLAFAIWSWRWSRSDKEAVLSAAGLSQLIAATAPRPLSPDELSKDENETNEGG